MWHNKILMRKMKGNRGMSQRVQRSFIHFWNIGDVEMITRTSDSDNGIRLIKFSNPTILDIGADFNYKIQLGSRCEHKNVTLKTAQTRAGDEGQETYKYCNDCKRIL